MLAFNRHSVRRPVLLREVLEISISSKPGGIANTSGIANTLVSGSIGNASTRLGVRPLPVVALAVAFESGWHS